MKIFKNKKGGQNAYMEKTDLINFNNAKEIPPEYNGSEKKKTMILNGKKYLVKFPDSNRSSKLNISYINNVYSEYIGSKIFNLLGVKTQNVELGYYDQDKRRFYVCACEDFTTENTKLIEFEKLENASIDSEGEKKDLADIKHIIELNTYNIDKEEFKKFFWDMFIIDCLIGNTDRHNGNFGFIKNVKTEELTLAPIYDCGSCLFSTLTDEKMEEILNKEGLLRDCIKNTSSAIKYNGSKIKYYDFITKMENKDCIEALNRIYPKIEIEKINNIIDEIPCISDIRKSFYKKIIKSKYNDILKVAYKKRKE